MKVAIISDIHDNIPNLKKVLGYCTENKIEKIICLGDLASLETLDFLNDNFSGEIFYTFGNMDNEYLQKYPATAEPRQGGGKIIQKYKNIKIFGDFGEIKFEVGPQAGRGPTSVAFVHFPEKAKELCRSGKYNFVFYGHTHKPWTEKVDNCVMLNPGNVANQFYPPTFAVWNTDNDSFELIQMNSL